MTQVRIAVIGVFIILWAGGRSSSVLAPQASELSHWRNELHKAQAEIQKNPKSAFWHDQAGIAYDALGDFKNAKKELMLASKLDRTNPIGYYALYAFYQRRGMLAQQREALLNALENDPANPLGHLQLGTVLEKEGYVEEAMREYQAAKELVSHVKGQEYVDARGNPYEIEIVRTEVDKCIDRVAKLKASKQRQD